MLQALDADLLVLGRDRGFGRAGDRDIGRKISPARERLGEIEADAGQRGFVIDLVVENAESVLGAHRLVGLADVDRVVAVERGLERIERGPPLFVAGEQIGERGEGGRLGGGRGRAQISGVGRGSAAADEFIAVVGFRVVRRGRDGGVGEPVRGILGRGGDRRAGELLGFDEVAAGDSARRRLRQLLRRLVLDLRADRGGGDPQRLGKPHRVARQVLARERPGLGCRGGPGEEDQKDGERAQSVEHVRPSDRLWADDRRQI